MALRDASWIISAFIVITVGLAGVCARHVDKRNRNKPRKHIERSVDKRTDEPRKSIETTVDKPINKSIDTTKKDSRKPPQAVKKRRYREPRDYIVDRA